MYVWTVNIYNIYITLVTLGSGAMMEKWSLTLRTRTLEPPFQLFRCVKSRLLECVLIDQASRRYTSEICYMALKQRWRKEKYKCNWNTNTNIHWNRGAERQRRKESDVCTMRKTLTMLHVLEISRWPCEDSGSPLIGNSAFLSWTWDIVTMQRWRPGPWWIASRFGGG